MKSYKQSTESKILRTTRIIRMALERFGQNKDLEVQRLYEDMKQRLNQCGSNEMEMRKTLSKMSLAQLDDFIQIMEEVSEDLIKGFEIVDKKDRDAE